MKIVPTLLVFLFLAVASEAILRCHKCEKAGSCATNQYTDSECNETHTSCRAYFNEYGTPKKRECGTDTTAKCTPDMCTCLTSECNNWRNYSSASAADVVTSSPSWLPTALLFFSATAAFDQLKAMFV